MTSPLPRVADGNPLPSEYWNTLVDTIEVLRSDILLSVRKLADESIASSTTLQNDDHLTFTDLPSAATFLLDGMIAYTGQTTGGGPGDLKVDWTIPTGATLRWARYGPILNSANAIDTVVTDHTTIRASGTFGVSTDVGFSPRGILVMGGSSGTLQMRWAQNSSTATATTLRANSWLRLQRVQ